MSSYQYEDVFEVGFLHEVEYVLAVEGDPVDDLDLLVEFGAEGQEFLDPHSF